MTAWLKVEMGGRRLSFGCLQQSDSAAVRLTHHDCIFRIVQMMDFSSPSKLNRS
ncbi:hypothetical protein KC19_1G040300 [Ceratodon purpureus]|uniref:Uncharacterized protein n=1 Tax=Ceratodon purpureus TaxID=3225 RepID=A0A8T0J159_CERPU|nr:hypothetical protein KC19_1G040300 [Ceratodon purpureus]